MKYLIGLKHQLSCIESEATILIKPVLTPAIQAEGGCAVNATELTICHVVRYYLYGDDSTGWCPRRLGRTARARPHPSQSILAHPAPSLTCVVTQNTTPSPYSIHQPNHTDRLTDWTSETHDNDITNCQIMQRMIYSVIHNCVINDLFSAGIHVPEWIWHVCRTLAFLILPGRIALSRFCFCVMACVIPDLPVCVCRQRHGIEGTQRQWTAAGGCERPRLHRSASLRVTAYIYIYNYIYPP